MRAGKCFLLLVVAATCLAVLYVEVYGGAALAGPPAPPPPCRVGARGPLVCSHKGFHQPWAFPKHTPLFPPLPGSSLVRSVTWLRKYLGVRCFDLDLIALADGAVVVGHPRDVAKHAALAPGAAVESLTLAQLHLRGRAADVAPTLAAFLEAVAGEPVEVVTFEAKGFDNATLAATAALLEKHRVAGRAHYMVWNPADPHAPLPAALPESVPAALGVRDAAHGGDPALFCDNTAPARYAMLAPSKEVLAACPAGDALRAGRPRVAVWNVHAADDARRVAARATTVITDYPAALCLRGEA
eukprot:TRINITY_DN2614_c0_g3_i1.p2 TRINITY_DN2614_c0_g3~~TRINITY_DN2614_c0_g3_i1.p2  ORF type:complete len:299 (+),score=103.16 TRINITY_DN2614_c0_g3_i1:59-955(+)